MSNVRITEIEKQSEVIREVKGAEAEELLRKYNHSNNPDQGYSSIKTETRSDLSFEEMIAQHENEIKNEMNKENSPKPITFGTDNGYNSISKYGTDDDLGFSFKIEISSDMILPK